MAQNPEEVAAPVAEPVVAEPVVAEHDERKKDAERKDVSDHYYDKDPEPYPGAFEDEAAKGRAPA